MKMTSSSLCCSQQFCELFCDYKLFILLPALCAKQSFLTVCIVYRFVDYC